MARVLKPQVQHFIYPLREHGDYIFAPGREVTLENFQRIALRGRVEEWGISSGFNLVAPGDWVWAYFTHDIKQIVGVGTVLSSSCVERRLATALRPN